MRTDPQVRNDPHRRVEVGIPSRKRGIPLVSSGRWASRSFWLSERSAHGGWLQADRAGLPAVAEAMLGSMLGLGLFSALLIRLAVVAASR